MTAARVLMTLDAVGGVWRFALDLAAGLRAVGTDVVLAGFGPEPDAAMRAEAEAVAPLHWAPEPLDWMAREPGALSGVGARLAALAARHRPGVLHLNLPSQAADLPEALPGNPAIVAMSHSCLATWFAAVRGTAVPPGLAWQAALTARGLARADLVLAPSRSHARAVAEVYGLQRPPRAVHNAVAGVSQPPMPRMQAVVAAGRWWDAGKNAAVLDAAAADCRWPVILLGPLSEPGRDAPPVRLRHATAIGAVPGAEARRRIAGAGVFVAPSLYEPFGLAALEAAAGGAPLVLADIPTFRELWDGAALFFDPHDPQALADRLRPVVADRALARRMGAAARRRAACHGREAQVRAMQAAHAEARAARGRRVVSPALPMVE